MYEVLLEAMSLLASTSAEDVLHAPQRSYVFLGFGFKAHTRQKPSMIEISFENLLGRHHV